MDTKQICPGCQKLLAPNAPQGLCPECLIKAGLGTGVEIGPDSQAEGGRVRFVAPTPEELVRPFPQLEILSFIGQGGMGAVYKARQKALDRVVALKILPPSIGKDPAFAQRFTREAKALAKLNHPGIVTLYEFGQADGLFYFLMEFVDGVNLRHLLAAGRLSPREALAIVPQICDALQYAHDQGIVHRDIKPENILLDRQGRVKVADFGLAKLVGGQEDPSAPGGGIAGSVVLTEAGKVMGTPHYMAPEQREHPAEVDHRADIYSLGVVLYQMLTGELPGKPMEPPSHTVRVDVRLDEVVLRALAKEPERRYQQVSQMKSAVETITTKPPGTQPPAGETVALPGATGMESIRRDVKGPAIGLVVTAILNWILIPLAFLVLAYWHAGLEDVPGSRPFLPIPLLALTPLVLCSFIIYAALKMMRLEARGAALAASVLAIIVTPGNIIGLPFGIWALVVLNRREVRAAFAGDKAALASVLSAPARSHAAWPWIVAAVGMVAVVMFLLIPVAMITVPALARRSHSAEAVRQKAQAAEQARSAVVQSQSRARLSQGEIELVGISFHPSTNQPWWRPDGSPCPEGPFELRSSTSSATGESMTREFVIRLTGLPADASGPVWKLDRGSWAGSSVQVRGQPVPDLQGISATVPKSARTMTIEVGVGMGAWETVANQVPGGSGITGVGHQGSNWVVSFPKAEGGPGGARILVTHTVRDWETRVLAVDKDGQEHPATGSESSGTDAFTQIIAKFPELPLERVKEFQFQVRPYEWGEFRDVALDPKQPPSGSSASWPRGFRAKADVSVPSIADVPEIERVVVSKDQAIIKQRRFNGEGMIFTFGTMTNRWTPGAVYFDHMFDVTLEWPWFGHGANWVVKTRHGIYASYRLDGPPGPMLGKIVFHPGTPAAEADGSYVIGEFKPETGVALPIAVRLVRDSKPSASPATAKTWSPALAAGEKPDLQKIRNEADSLMNQGRYEEALQRKRVTGYRAVGYGWRAG